MTKRRATCSCGQLALTCEGEPVRISICHCLECQKRTGSAFGIQPRFPIDRVTIEGASTEFVRLGDSGNPVRFHFCATCGATVYWEASFMPDHVAVAIGAFADPSFPAPVISVYDHRRHPWAEMPALPIERRD